MQLCMPIKTLITDGSGELALSADDIYSMWKYVTHIMITVNAAVQYTHTICSSLVHIYKLQPHTHLVQLPRFIQFEKHDIRTIKLNKTSTQLLKKQNITFNLPNITLKYQYAYVLKPSEVKTINYT